MDPSNAFFFPLEYPMRISIALLLPFIVIAAVRADDWPQWMGPQRDNVWREKGIVDTFPKDGPKFLWRAKVANGYSGPAVADGLVYLTDFIPDDDVQKDNFARKKFAGKERVQCFDAKTGEFKWKHEYRCVYSVSYPNGPRCTPTVDAGKVYTLGAEGNLFCFDAKTGKEIWSRDFKKDYGAATPLWGFAAHPLVDGDRLICMVGGEGSIAVAFDKNTGKEIWKALSAEQPGYSPPTLIESAGARQLLIWHPESLNSLDPASGKVNWSVDQPTVNGTSIMSPRALGDFIYLGAWQQKGTLLKLDSNLKTAPKAIWKGKRDTAVYPINNTPFLEAGHIYGVCTDGELRCVELKTGERVWESYKPVAGEKAGSGTAHLVKHDDRFFIATETGDLVIAKLSPKGYEEISRWHMQEPTSKAHGRSVVWSHPAFAQQCVFARNDKELICVSLAK
jgi:outer membrane protein assembly factor BamB